MLVFLHGTIIMHRTGLNRTRTDRIKQSVNQDRSVLDYASYIPIGKAVDKLNIWKKQGANIIYLSSHESSEDVEKDKVVLRRFNFPKGKVYYRQNGESYSDIVEKIIPDIYIEDNCESIGGEKEMASTYFKSKLKERVKTIIVEEFAGIDNLPNDMYEL